MRLETSTDVYSVIHTDIGVACCWSFLRCPDLRVSEASAAEHIRDEISRSAHKLRLYSLDYLFLYPKLRWSAFLLPSSQCSDYNQTTDTKEPTTDR